MMNLKKQQALLRKQTSVAKKVFELVPIQEPASKAEIYAASQRQNYTIGKNIVEGVLNGLVEDRLVREPTIGTFIRAPVSKPVEVPTLKEHHIRTPKETPVPKPKLTLAESGSQSIPELLLGLAELAERLASEVSDLAEKINTVSLAAEEQATKENSEIAQLRQLKALLKD